MNRQTMRVLGDVYTLHKTVMAGFASYSDFNRVLFRVEPEVKEDLVQILVQSNVNPKWASPVIVNFQVKEFNPKVREGMKLRFRLRANPTVTRNGKRYGLIRDESLEEWLRKKEKNLGVQFHSMSVADEGYVTGSRGKGDHRLNIKTALYHGFLTIRDGGLFKKALSQGVGPGKAFGCGLLSLARG